MISISFTLFDSHNVTGSDRLHESVVEEDVGLVIVALYTVWELLWVRGVLETPAISALSGSDCGVCGACGVGRVYDDDVERGCKVW